MSFDEVTFPISLSYGSQGGPGHRTVVVETQGGREERIQVWPSARRQWNARYGIRRQEDLATITTFYLARAGAKRGFRFRDPGDFTSSATYPFRAAAIAVTDQLLGLGDGSTTTFQLIKKYVSGGNTITRTITKPVASTVIVAVNGVTKTEGADYSVNTTTGIITFGTAPPSSQTVTAGFLFDVPARFGDEADQSLSLSFEDFESGSTAIPIVELFEDTNVEDDFNWGGHLDVTLSVSRSLSVNEARSYSLDAQSGSLYVQLPSPTNLPAGGAYFFIHNEGATHAINLKDHNGTTLLSIATGTSVVVILAIDHALTKLWIAF